MGKEQLQCKIHGVGGWIFPSMPYIKYTWEFIEVFDKETIKRAGDARISTSAADEFKEWVMGRWSFPPEIRMKENDYPAMFPEEFPRRLMKLFSYRNDLVLDPFNGVGTTTAVAGNSGMAVYRYRCVTTIF